jgi:protein-histidine pros-kinase
MGIRTKLNLWLLIVFLAGAALAAYFVRGFLYDNAREEVIRNAGFMMETAMAIRGYTVAQVRPHLEKVPTDDFLPQTVPAFAATETLRELRKQYPDYSYKEATINATNPRDEASGWEIGVVEEFRHAPHAEIVRVRYADGGRKALFVARPIKITNAACLVCHTEPAIAPVSMRRQYGDTRGFGWQLNQTVGAQIVSVPMDVPERAAERAFYTFLAVLLGVFALVFLALNLLLEAVVVRPLRRITDAADQISLGQAANMQSYQSRKDEIGTLAAAVGRLHAGLRRAMSLLDKQAPSASQRR